MTTMLKGLQLVKAVEPGPFDWSKIVDDSYLPEMLKDASRSPEPSASCRMADEHLRVTGVTRVYPPVEGHAAGAVHALGPIDLTLKKGEFFSVVGPSGCGKSTLARCRRRACEAERG